jgi:hypothetical protein
MTKGRAVLALLLLAGVLWIVASQAWGSAAPGAAGPSGVAEVAGEEATGHPVLTACAAIIAVASLLLAMMGRVGRIVVCVLVALVGAGAALTALTTTGPTVPVVLATTAGAAIVAVAVWTAVVSPRWTVSSRYDRDSAPGASADDDPAAAWDALSRGEDPS